MNKILEIYNELRLSSLKEEISFIEKALEYNALQVILPAQKEVEIKDRLANLEEKEIKLTNFPFSRIYHAS